MANGSLDGSPKSLEAPAPIAGPVVASFTGAPRLSVVGVIFPGFLAGLVPPMQINGEDADRYNTLVVGTTRASVVWSCYSSRHGNGADPGPGQSVEILAPLLLGCHQRDTRQSGAWQSLPVASVS